MTDAASLPDYEPLLASYHRAFAGELRRAIASLPIAPGQAVLDMACGDGAYSPWLAEAVGPSGRVVAVDVSAEYLAVARRAVGSTNAAPIDYVRAPIEALPFDDGTFDLCWCAQSLYSLPDPVDALRRLRRVTKPGGVVAVLEGDSLHHVILPWPIEVEISVRAAELQILAEQSERPRKFYVGRQLRRVFREAEFEDVVVRTLAHDRAAPLWPEERRFFGTHLREMSDQILDRLHEPIKTRFAALIDPEDESYLLDDPDLTATCVDQLAWGRKSR